LRPYGRGHAVVQLHSPVGKHFVGVSSWGRHFHRGGSMRPAVMRFGIIGLVVVVVAAYVALVELYEDTVEGVAANTLTDNPGVVAQSTATLTVEEMESNHSAVVANLAVSPGSALLDP